MIYKFTSAKAVINKIYRDLNLTTEINEAHVYEWIGEVLSVVGAYSQYEENIKIIQLSDGKAQLPANFEKLVYISCGNKPLSFSSSSQLNNYDCPDCKIPTCCTDYHFYISDNMIITDIKDTEPITQICLTYLGVPVDNEGYPLVPDEVYFMKACAAYVTYMLDYREWRKGNVPDKVLNKSEQEYLFYVNSARGAANLPDERHLRNIKNVWTRLIPNQNDENHFFQKNINPERKFRH